MKLEFLDLVELTCLCSHPHFLFFRSQNLLYSLEVNLSITYFIREIHVLSVTNVGDKNWNECHSKPYVAMLCCSRTPSPNGCVNSKYQS